MQLRVEKIATIEFRHDFFKSSGLDWNADWPSAYTQDFIPSVKISNSCKRKLVDWGIFLRSSPKGFDLFAEVKQSGNSFLLTRPQQKNTELYFFLIQPQNEWGNITKTTGLLDGLNLFSNTSGTKPPGASSNYFLHNEIPDSYNGTKQAGEVVRKGNKVYEAKELTSTKPTGSKWTEIGSKIDFTTLSNRIQPITRYLRISEGSLAGALIEVKDIYENVVYTETLDALSTEKEKSIDISQLNEGVYSYTINAIEKGRFLKVDDLPKRAFAAVQLVLQNNPADLTAPQKLTEEWLPVANGEDVLQAGEINPRQFIIHFLPNSAKWKYLFSKEIPIEVSEVNSAGFQKLTNTAFISDDIITINKYAQGADFGLDQRLPAASTNLIIPQYNASDEIESYVSEIYVNV